MDIIKDKKVVNFLRFYYFFNEFIRDTKKWTDNYGKKLNDNMLNKFKSDNFKADNERRGR
ncbi:hypothetical protein [Clostridium botulinum]|uniref:hypothetical protein n=1 Tax=Clostridium botulinum TaxID=1491 RepID=UPI000774AC7F|nr:hypothetical protein [Clostridium botulinum]NFE93559.1 hypothetical protein [Clostridium botulinum]NFL38120.1 hypothetical protein [Clostridium botulinum]NFL64392.1 hypothetical protein [Clostridium botulinum]NFN07939.1 hypothetical protein [Clostridium botulinum]NFN24156.1 hypothetical protein [Clostridium botulinum]